MSESPQNPLNETTSSTPPDTTPPPHIHDEGYEDDVVISRVAFNYVVIAIACLVIGAVVGILGYDRVSRGNQDQTDALINRAVSTAVASIPMQVGTGNTSTESMVQAVGTAVAAQATAMVPTPLPTLDPNIRYDVSVADNPFLGPEDAPVTIIEFADFRCGFCKRFNDNTMQQILDTYGDNVRLVFRDYPILGPESQVAALAGECADDQSQFWPFHDMVYANQQFMSRSQYITYAEQLELDVERFTICLDEQEHLEENTNDYLAGVALGISGTPTFYINGKIIIGAQDFSAFAAVIDAELALIESGEASS